MSGGLLELYALDGSNGFAINGIAASDESGIAVHSIGDLNKDSIVDIMIGAPGAGVGYVVYGKSGIGSGGSLELSSLNGAMDLLSMEMVLQICSSGPYMLNRMFFQMPV